MQTSSLAVSVKLWALFCVISGVSLAAAPESTWILAILAFGHIGCQRRWRLLFSFGLFYLLLASLLYLVRFHGLRLIVFSEFSLLMLYNLLPVFVVASDLITTPPGQLAATLSKAHAPTAVILGLLVLFRFFPTMKAELKGVYQSMKNRQLTGVVQGISHPFITIEYVLVPMLLRCLQIADQLSVSAVTRGAEAPGVRSSYYAAEAGARDYLWAILWIPGTLLAVVSGGAG